MNLKGRGIPAVPDSRDRRRGETHHQATQAAVDPSGDDVTAGEAEPDQNARGGHLGTGTAPDGAAL